jgi:hypothetical protein
MATHGDGYFGSAIPKRGGEAISYGMVFLRGRLPENRRTVDQIGKKGIFRFNQRRTAEKVHN